MKTARSSKVPSVGHWVLNTKEGMIVGKVTQVRQTLKELADEMACYATSHR